MSFRIAYITGPLAVSAMIALAGDAHAAFTRLHASGCFPITPHNQTFDPAFLDNDYTVTSGLLNSGNEPQELMCPAPDNDVVSKFQYHTVNVEVYNSNFAAASAAICEDFWNSNGGTCAQSVSAGAGGHFSIALGPSIGSVWTSASEGHFGYVVVSLNSNNNGGFSELRGIFFGT
jgi:hypothetical protein